MFACFNCLISLLISQLYQLQSVLKRVSQSKAALWFWSLAIRVATMYLAPLKYMSFLTHAGMNCFSCTVNVHTYPAMPNIEKSEDILYRFFKDVQKTDFQDQSTYNQLLGNLFHQKWLNCLTVAFLCFISIWKHLRPKNEMNWSLLVMIQYSRIKWRSWAKFG